MSRHVWVCLGARCRRSGSQEVWEHLTQALTAETDMEVHRYDCFGACAVAPNLNSGVARLALLKKGRHAFREVCTGTHLVAQCLVERFAR